MKGSSLRDWRDLTAWLEKVDRLLTENTRVRSSVTYDVRAAVRKMQSEGA